MTNDGAEAVNRLVDEYRQRCLWFLRSDYYPVGDAERLRVLAYIERYGDRDAYRRAAERRASGSQVALPRRGGAPERRASGGSIWRPGEIQRVP